MRLIYTKSRDPVAEGDCVTVRGQNFTVDYFAKPHKPDSEGKVTLLAEGAERPHGTEFYVGVIGAEWIDREDRAARCGICNRLLDQPGDPASGDCGGDCTQCMADAGDPDCIEALRQSQEDPPADFDPENPNPDEDRELREAAERERVREDGPQ